MMSLSLNQLIIRIYNFLNNCKKLPHGFLTLKLALNKAWL